MKTFLDLERHCARYNICCERTGRKIELTTPDGSVTAECSSVADAIATVIGDSTFSSLPRFFGTPSALRERLAKTAPEFRAKIGATAREYDRADVAVYELWLRYAETCENGDQSPVWSEFLEWNEAALAGNVTLREVKAGAAVGAPLYVSKPYVLLCDGIVNDAGTLDELKALGEYHDDKIVAVRRHDLDANDNTRLAPVPVELYLYELCDRDGVLATATASNLSDALPNLAASERIPGDHLEVCHEFHFAATVTSCRSTTYLVRWTKVEPDAPTARNVAKKALDFASYVAANTTGGDRKHITETAQDFAALVTKGGAL